MDATVTAAQIREAVHRAAPEAPVVCHQTGGSTATVFVGTPNADQRYWLSIGPGSYDWSDEWKSDFFLDGLSIGHDDDGETESAFVDELIDITRIVRQEARYLPFPHGEEAES